MKRVHPLPTLLTLGNFGTGFVAIVLAARSLTGKEAPALFQSAHVTDADMYLYLACACTFVSMLFDLLDGKVARMTGSACQFGGELDSLADVVSFGISPAVIYTVSWIHVEPDTARWWSMVLGFGFIYAACACLRLARYNVEMDVSAKNYFAGLPTPGAGGAVITMFLLVHKTYIYGPLAELLTKPGLAKLLAGYMLVIGLLMVSRVRYAHASNRLLGGRKRFTHLVLALFLLALLVQFPVMVLALAFNGYVLHGLVTSALRGRRTRRHPGGPEAAEKEPLSLMGIFRRGLRRDEEAE
jgi:CDP-diacylglycerol--serine O-phosphatidyltransferase